MILRSHSSPDDGEPGLSRISAAQLFGHGLKFVPGIKYQKFMTWHITEEMQH